jgi:hypothetical protein
MFFHLFTEIKIIDKAIIALENIVESHHHHMDMISCNIIFLRYWNPIDQAMSWHASTDRDGRALDLI